MKTSVYVATSVDGFIARENGDIDWLPAPADANAEDYGYQSFFDSVDALVMGRNTYELVTSFGGWPYGDKPVFVLTSRELEIPVEIEGTVSKLCAEPEEVVQILAKKGYQHLYIDGGNTIQRFLAEGLIQTLIITKIPILIGCGISLFGKLPQDVRLKHIETHQYKNGMVQDTYQVIDG